MGSVHNPTEVTIGAVQLSGVLVIEWGEHRRETISPPGDGEIYHPAVGYAPAVAGGKLVFADPPQADAASGLFGTLTATLEGVGGGADRTLTITNVRTGGAENIAGHNRAAKCGVDFLAASSDAVASPVTLT